jgi:hypothetical protein
VVDEVIIDALTSVQVAGDGSAIRLLARTPDGQDATVILPSIAARQLMMTLPRVISKAIATEHKDETLRLVFTLDRWQLERTAGSRVILTLATADNFEITFAVDAHQSQDIEATLATARDVSLQEPIRLN